MYNGISGLPELLNIENYKSEDNIDYCKLIEDVHNNFVMDFLNPSAPVYFDNKKVVFNENPLDCSVLKIQNCYNQQYYNCDNCKFKECYDIFNHICTDDYETLYKEDKNIQVPKLKKRKRNRKIPRTPGRFNVNRLCRVNWIKFIIEHSNDSQNVIVKKNSYKDSDEEILVDVSITLLKEKYKIIIKPIYNNATREIKYYILKTAYYMDK